MTSHQFHDCDGFLLVYRGVQRDFADSGSHIFGCASKAGGVIGPDQVIVDVYKRQVYGYIAFAVIAMLLIHFVKNISRRNMNGDGRKE